MNITKLAGLGLLAQTKGLSIADLMLLWRTKGVPLLPSTLWTRLWIGAITLEQFLNELSEELYQRKMRLLERMK